MNKRAINILASLFLLFASYDLQWARGSVGTGEVIEPRYLIDLPTAGIIPHKYGAFDLNLFQDGGLLLDASVGAFNRVLIGVSYGGSNVIGTAKPSWNPVPGVMLRVRVIDESIVLPAIALGFDSQGKESYLDASSRYVVKSLGVYAVASKNYSLAGFLSWHGGMNYSLERTDGDRDVDFFCGAEKTIGSFASAVAEYDFGLNDNGPASLGRSRGYLNIGLKVSMSESLTFAFNFKDVLQNRQDNSFGNRTLTLEYVSPL